MFMPFLGLGMSLSRSLFNPEGNVSEIDACIPLMWTDGLRNISRMQSVPPM